MSGDMRVLTLWQPWATLMVPEFPTRYGKDRAAPKSIETRSWSTAYRGPVLIHASAKPVPKRMVRYPEGQMGDYTVQDDGPGTDCYLLDGGWRSYANQQLPIDLPLGAVLGVGDLVDCLPVATEYRRPYFGGGDHLAGAFTAPDRSGLGDGLFIVRRDPGDHDRYQATDVSDQLPFGDFTPGRFGWVFENVRALPKPIPWKGGQGLRHAPPELLEAIRGAS